MRIGHLIPLALLVSAAYGADFTTYIGDQNQYQVNALAADSAGNTYVTGGRVIQPPEGNASNDVFVTKLDASGNIVFTATFGGKGTDLGNAIAVDSEGNIWVGGSTSSENFPLRDALQMSPGSGNPGGTGFLVRLAPDGTVIYSSYFGGLLGRSSVNGVATNQSGNVYVTGTTDSSDFPTTPGIPAGSVTANEITPVSGAFITKLDPSGLHVVYSALIVGNAVDCSGGSSCFLMGRYTSGVGIAIDAAGDAFVAGNTNTTNLPVTAGVASGYGAFAAEINSAGNKLVYLTYLGLGEGLAFGYGPSESINATAVAADAAGNSYLTGYTNDPAFPATPGAYQTKLNGTLANAFAIKLNPSGAPIWATYVGALGYDQANSIGLDASGEVWLVGTDGVGFPSNSPWFTAGGPGDFLAELNPNGSALSYTADFPAESAGQTAAVDQNGVVHLAGESGLVSTVTPAQPFTSRVLGVVNAAVGQIAGRIAAGEVISIFGFGLGPATSVTAAPGSTGFFPTSLGGVQVLVNGTAIPLLYVSASQINAEIPAPLPGMYDAVIQVINNSAALPDFRVSVDDYIFAMFLSPGGSIAAINQDGTVNSASNPAKAGTIVSIWATGFSGSAGPVDGAVAKAANNWCSYCLITIGSLHETVAYAGAAPGLIDGIMQINFMIPTQIGEPSQLSLDFDGLGLAGFLYASQ